MAAFYCSPDLARVDADDVYLGNRVSELIAIVLQAFVNDGTEVHIPSPDYPLRTAAVRLCGGTAVHYRLTSSTSGAPIWQTLKRKSCLRLGDGPHQPRTSPRERRAARRSFAFVDIARRHELVIMADEVYERILFEGAQHHHAATDAGDHVLCLTFIGLSKAYRACGYRCGWVVVTGPKHAAAELLEGLTLIANMRMRERLCPACRSRRLVGNHPIYDLIGPGDRYYEQAALAQRTGCSTTSLA